MTKKTIHSALQRTQHIITDSEYVRSEIANYFNWPLERIAAIPLACSDKFHPREKSKGFEVMHAHGLRWKEYSLFAGTIEPRKNLDGLLDAYQQLPLADRRLCPLVICGSKGWKSDDTHNWMKAAEQEGWVRYLGYVTDRELPILYAGARVFLFPSWYEGFGLPVLEAMASGTPVVCSDVASLPEVAGGAALMCPPDNFDQLSGLIARALQDDRWRQSAAEQGLRQAGKFSWQQCAVRTAEVYRAVLDGI